MQALSASSSRMFEARRVGNKSPVVVARQQNRVVRASAQQATLPASLQKIVGAFQMVPDPMARYKQLLYFANKLEKLPAEDHTPQNKVEGCVSQVWVKPELRADGKLYWSADSDSQLTKGLAALLVVGLSGCTPQEILQLEPSFIGMLGLQQSLTPSRNNGFLNMFKLMQRKTLETAASLLSQQEQQAASSSGSEGDGASSNGSGSQGNGVQASSSSSERGAASSSSGGSSSSSRTPIQDGMRRKIEEALQPTQLMIKDDSASHASHAARMVAPGTAGSSGETHFTVHIVSPKFEGLTLVKRQRLVYSLLSEEFNAGLHALSLHTKTPAEVESN